MGWETRKRGGRYYTRSRRVGGQVLREYVGGGVLGEIAALEDEYERQRREQQAAYEREEHEQLQALTAPAEELCDAVEVIAHAALLTSGYHKHKGQWRKRRDTKKY
jgi:hypothetical protein